MKQFFSLLAIIAVLYSCNDNKKAASNETKPGIAIEEKQLKDAIAQHPDSLLLKELLIEYYSENEAFDKAIAVTNEALKKDSANPRIWEIRATVYLDNEDTVTAIKSFETAVRLYPDPVYVKSLGSLYAQTKNPKALQIADSMLASRTPEATKDALFLKGWYYNYTGDSKKAIQFLDQCLSMDYTYMFAYREKAIALYNMGKYNDAISVLEKATTLQNAFDEGYYWIGRCYEKLDKKNDAVENYQLAIKMAKQNNDDNIDAEDALERLGAK